MRILFLTSAFPPESEGAATHLPELCESLQQSGHRVSVLAVVNRHEIKDTYPFRVKRISRSQVSLVRSLRVLWNLINHGKKAQVIYTYGVWWQAAVASFITGTPWVIKFVRDNIWEEQVEKGLTQDDLVPWNTGKKPFITSIRHGFTKCLAQLAKHSVVSCNTLCQLLIEWGIAREKIEIIPNALPKNPKEEEEATYLAQWTEQEHIRLITTGHISKAKNLELTLEAIETKENVRLVVVGDGPYLDKIKAVTLEKNMGDRVLFTGKVSRQDLAGYVKECDILVMSSLLGHFNYVVLEALKQSKAIFASRRGVHPDMIEHDENGWLFSADNSQELFQLVDDFENKNLMINQHDEDNTFSWESYVDQTNEVLNSVTH